MPFLWLIAFRFFFLLLFFNHSLISRVVYANGTEMNEWMDVIYTKQIIMSIAFEIKHSFIIFPPKLSFNNFVVFFLEMEVEKFIIMLNFIAHYYCLLKSHSIKKFVNLFLKAKCCQIFIILRKLKKWWNNNEMQS